MQIINYNSYLLFMKINYILNFIKPRYEYIKIKSYQIQFKK